MAKKNGSKAKARDRLELEQTMSTAEVAGYLETLATGLRDGAILIEDGAEGFRVPVNGSVDLEVDARQGKRKARIGLTIAFRSAPAVADTSEPAEPEQPVDTLPDEMSF